MITKKIKKNKAFPGSETLRHSDQGRNMIRKSQSSTTGFVILFVVIVSSIILAVTLAITNISLKEIKFSTSAKDTNDALFAADTGAECALINDKSTGDSFVQTGSSGIVSCLGQTIPLSGAYPSWNFILSGLGSAGLGCAKVSVDKTVSPTAVISKGYNIGDASCNSSSTNRVERELQLTFVDNVVITPTELVVDGDMESNPVANWPVHVFGGTPPTKNVETTIKHGGAQSLRLADLDDGWAGFIYQSIPATVGTTYTASGWFYRPSVNGNACSFMVGNTTSNVLDRWKYTNQLVPITEVDTWVQKTVTFVSSDTTLIIQGDLTNNSIGTYCYMDDFSLMAQ